MSGPGQEYRAMKRVLESVIHMYREGRSWRV